jgi:hypothetical protein
VALRSSFAVDEHGAGVQQPLGGSARADTVLTREEAVEARARVAARNA